MKTASLLSMMIFLTSMQRPLTPDSRPVILAFGDSLTAGYGVPPGSGYPDLLQRRLDGLGYKYRVVGMGISGDTTSGGRARMRSRWPRSPPSSFWSLARTTGCAVCL